MDKNNRKLKIRFCNWQIYPKGKTPEKKALNSDQPIKGKGGALYRKHGGFALETQHYPDAVNKVGFQSIETVFWQINQTNNFLQANFATVIVLPGDVYKHELIYKFGVEPVIEVVPQRK